MINKLNRAFIFDLDGVITETSEYHFLAWKTVCKKIGYDLTRKKNEKLKGVNRNKCLDLIMEWGKICLLYTSPSPRDMRRSRMPSSA